MLYRVDRYVRGVSTATPPSIRWAGAASARWASRHGRGICNAVYHVSGRRVRDLPITVDKLL
jgi:hypothetical protein